MMREVLTRRFKRLLKEHGLPAGESTPSPASSSRGAERAVAIQGVICDPGLLRSARNDEERSAGIGMAPSADVSTTETEEDAPLTLFLSREGRGDARINPERVAAERPGEGTN